MQKTAFKVWTAEYDGKLIHQLFQGVRQMSVFYLHSRHFLWFHHPYLVINIRDDAGSFPVVTFVLAASIAHAKIVKTDYAYNPW